MIPLICAQGKPLGIGSVGRDLPLIVSRSSQVVLEVTAIVEAVVRHGPSPPPGDHYWPPKRHGVAPRLSDTVSGPAAMGTNMQAPKHYVTASVTALSAAILCLLIVIAARSAAMTGTTNSTPLDLRTSLTR